MDAPGWGKQRLELEERRAAVLVVEIAATGTEDGAEVGRVADGQHNHVAVVFDIALTI